MLRRPREGDDVAGQARRHEPEQRPQPERDAHDPVNDADGDELADHRGPAQLDEPRQVDAVAVGHLERFGAVHAVVKRPLGLEDSNGSILGARAPNRKPAADADH